MIDGYRFVNADHERTYLEAKVLLASEDARQLQEAERMKLEWRTLPDPVRMERLNWLQRHFWECRQPYIKLLTDILALATTYMVIPLDDAGT